MTHDDFVRAGVEDARQGLAFDNDYETWPPTMQCMYEIGRLLVVNMQAARWPLGPVWQDGEAVPAWLSNAAAQLGPIYSGGIP